MRKNESKHLWQLKKNDKIYILDFGEIEKGFQEFKVIKNKHHKETVFSCSYEKEIEYYTLEFSSPYLNRYVYVYKDNGFNSKLSFTYAWQENGLAKTKQVYLIITSDISYGIERTLYEITSEIKSRRHSISSKVSTIEKMNMEIEFDKAEIVRLENMLEKINLINEKA